MRKLVLVTMLFVCSTGFCKGNTCASAFAIEGNVDAREDLNLNFDKVVEDAQICKGNVCEVTPERVVKSMSDRIPEFFQSYGINRKVGVTIGLMAVAGLSSYAFYKGFAPPGAQVYAKGVATLVGLSLLYLIKPVKDPLKAKISQFFYRLYGEERESKPKSVAEDFMKKIWLKDEGASTPQVRHARGVLNGSVGAIGQAINIGLHLKMLGENRRAVEYLANALSYAAYVQPVSESWIHETVTQIKIGFVGLEKDTSKEEFVNMMIGYERARYEASGVKLYGEVPSLQYYQKLGELIFN